MTLWTSTSTALMCPVNLPNEDKLAYYASPSPTRAVVRGTRRGFLLQRPLPLPRPRGGHAAVQLVSDCQKHNVYYSIIIVGPSEEAKSQVQGSHEYELLNLPKRQRSKCKVL